MDVYRLRAGERTPRTFVTFLLFFAPRGRISREKSLTFLSPLSTPCHFLRRANVQVFYLQNQYLLYMRIISSVTYISPCFIRNIYHHLDTPLCVISLTYVLQNIRFSLFVSLVASILILPREDNALLYVISFTIIFSLTCNICIYIYIYTLD